MKNYYIYIFTNKIECKVQERNNIIHIIAIIYQIHYNSIHKVKCFWEENDMADKKVYFYKISLFDNLTKKELEPEKLKDIFMNAYNSNLEDGSLLLNDDSEEPIYLDINSKFFGEDGVFGTIGKIRDMVGFRKRNKFTKGVKSLLSKEELAEQGIECFTYFSIDFKIGILTVVSSQSSPSEKVINNVLAKYNQNYYTTICVINSKDAYKQLFKKNSKFTKLTCKINKPSIEMMKELNLPKLFRLKAIENDSCQITIEIKSIKKKPFAENNEDTFEIMPMIEELLHNEDLHDIIVTGNPSGNKQREFPLKEMYVYDKIDVKPYKVESGEREYFDLSDIEKLFKEELIAVYRRNRDELVKLITLNN